MKVLKIHLSLKCPCHMSDPNVLSVFLCFFPASRVFRNVQSFGVDLPGRDEPTSQVGVHSGQVDPPGPGTSGRRPRGRAGCGAGKGGTPADRTHVACVCAFGSEVLQIRCLHLSRKNREYVLSKECSQRFRNRLATAWYSGV